MIIDKKTHKINQKHYHELINEKTQIIIGFSLRKDDYHINRLKHKKYGKTKKWNTYTISRDGQIFEHFEPKYYSDFIGLKNIDKQSISIVLENMGSLLKNQNNDFINWVNEKCDKRFVEKKKWLGYSYWEIFPEEQMKSALSLCQELCKNFNIKKNVIDFHYQHSDIGKFEGIVLKSNFFEDSSSINPFFDLSKFNEMLNK